MRVALVAPPYPLEEAPSPPLGLSYAASAFEQAGAEVRILDYIVSRYTPDKLKRALDEFQPDLVGTTSVTMNFIPAAEILKTAKQWKDSLITLMGGPHVSFDAAGTLKAYPEIDLLVIGEGETTIRELVRVLNKGERWQDIKGLAYRRGEDCVVTESRELIADLDELALPARHLLPMSRYLALGFPATMITGRGCPYGCIFCLGRKMVGPTPRARKAALVVDEMEELLAYGFSRINIADDLFTAQKEKVREVCEEIGRRNLKVTWTAFSRVNTVDRETLKLMRESGCDCISFGIESGNPEMLKRIRKGITLDQARQAVALCKEAGILTHASFMVGLPGETAETLRDTAEFSKSLDILYGFHFLAPFPGTTVREKIDQYDLEILTDDWSRYDANSAIVRTEALSAEDINRFVGAFDGEIQEAWEKQIQGYYDKTNTPEEDLRVEGHFRMQLVYKILSQDLLEACGTVPLEGLPEKGDSSLDTLCRRIQERTGSDAGLVSKTLHYFKDAGFIRSRPEGSSDLWYWTHNRKKA
jgi:anaerobic magnesium-protoporphyrin IX monomethyl ester cyclase